MSASFERRAGRILAGQETVMCLMGLVVVAAGDADRPWDARTEGFRSPTLDNLDRGLEVFENATLALRLALVLEKWVFHLRVSAALTVSPG